MKICTRERRAGEGRTIARQSQSLALSKGRISAAQAQRNVPNGAERGTGWMAMAIE